MTDVILPNASSSATDRKPPAPSHSEAGWFEEKLPRAIRPYRAHPVRTLAAIAACDCPGLADRHQQCLPDHRARTTAERCDHRPLACLSQGRHKGCRPLFGGDLHPRCRHPACQSGEGLALTAREDSSGYLLDPTCVYRIAGQTPSARLWTLTATDGHGRLTETLPGRVNLSQRHACLRNQDGTF